MPLYACNSPEAGADPGGGGGGGRGGQDTPPPFFLGGGTHKLHKEVGGNVARVCAHATCFSTKQLPGPPHPLSEILYPPLRSTRMFQTSSGLTA